MRGLIKNNKAAAHFEMIFSFVFFTGFVFFLFMVLTPEDTSTLSGSVISALYDSFEEEVYTNLSSMFLKANYTGEVTCFKIILPEDIFAYSLSGGNSRVVTFSGDDVDSSLVSSSVGGTLNINNSDTFFRVSVSPEFDDEDVEGCDPLEHYELGSVLERRVVSYSALEAMAVKYSENYEGLRSDLRVPGIFDFSIVSENMSNIDMKPLFGVPDSVEVMAQNYVMEVLNKNGELRNERFTLKIW